MLRATKTRQQLILIVDDEPLVRHIAGVVLRREGLNTLEAADGMEGIRLVHERGDHITMVLTDVRMPRLDGFSMATSVRALYPSMPIIFMSGYSDPTSEKRLKGSLFLEKPFHPETLLEAVQRLLCAD